MVSPPGSGQTTQIVVASGTSALAVLGQPHADVQSLRLDSPAPWRSEESRS